MHWWWSGLTRTIQVRILLARRGFESRLVHYFSSLRFWRQVFPSPSSAAIRYVDRPECGDQAHGNKDGSGQVRPVAGQRCSKPISDHDRMEQLADLYAILMTTEHLETAYVRDAVSTDEYAPACAKLIAQYKTIKVAVSFRIPVFFLNWFSIGSCA